MNKLFTRIISQKPFGNLESKKLILIYRNMGKVGTNAADLDSQIVKQIWSKNKKLRSIDFTEIEFYSIFNDLYKSLSLFRTISLKHSNFWEFRSSNIQKKLSTSIFGEIDSTTEMQRLTLYEEKYLRNKENWSIIFENIDSLIDLMATDTQSNKDDSFNLDLVKKDNIIFNKIEFSLIHHILNRQEDLLRVNQSPEVFLEDFYTNSIRLKCAKQIVQLADSLRSYLLSYFKEKTIIENNLILQCSLLKTKFMYINYHTYLDLNFTKSEYCKEVKNELKKLMMNFKGFDYMGIEDKKYIVLFSSFYKDYLLSVIDNLLYTLSNQEYSTEFFQFFIFCLKGLYRFNIDLDDKILNDKIDLIYSKMSEWIVKHNIIKHKSLENLENLYIDFFLMAKSKSHYLSDKQITHLMKSWSLLEFIPSKMLLLKIMKSADFKIWIYEKKSIDELNQSIDENEYKKSDLMQLAEIIKQKAIGNKTFLTDRLEPFELIDTFLSSREGKANKFIIDGLNVFFKNQISRGEFLKNLLIKLDDRHSNVVILRNHLKSKVLEDLQLKKSKVFFLNNHLPDDLYTIYAAVKSSLNNKTYIITNDRMENHSNIEENYFGYLLKNFIFNRRIRISPSFTLLYPPSFKIKVQKFPSSTQNNSSKINNDNISDRRAEQWLIPCISFMKCGTSYHEFYVLKKKTNHY